MATCSSFPACRIPGTEGPGGPSPWGRKESDVTEQLTQLSSAEAPRVPFCVSLAGGPGPAPRLHWGSPAAAALPLNPLLVLISSCSKGSCTRECFSVSAVFQLWCVYSLMQAGVCSSRAPSSESGMEVPRTFWKRSVSGAGRCWASVQGCLGRASLGVP